MPSILDTIDRPHRGIHRPRRRTHPIDRIRQAVAIDENGCWIWQKRIMNRGYGELSVSQAGYKPLALLAHRVSYELHKGRIPEGMVVDHLCRVRACVNPDHLEVVTQRENVMRSPIAPGALNAQKTHCPKGHPYDEENTIWYSGKGFRGRTCRTCSSERCQRYYAERASRGAAVAS